MFNCLPGTMLCKRHSHECKKGFSCGRALLHNSTGTQQSQGIQSGPTRRQTLCVDITRIGRRVVIGCILLAAGEGSWNDEQ
jgi:hypothetical protein